MARACRGMGNSPCWGSSWPRSAYGCSAACGALVHGWPGDRTVPNRGRSMGRWKRIGMTEMTMTTDAVRTRDITPDNLTAPAFLALPEGRGPFPGVVVIHELFGLNENIRDITRRFAENGYAALAV